MVLPIQYEEYDYTEISWNLPINGYAATIKIFDDYGRDVVTLRKAEVIAPQDKVIYHGSNLRSGIYIIFIELLHPYTGKKHRYKYPLAVR